MQVHHGSRLKFLIENSRFTVVDISKKSGIATSSIYEIFKKDEILRAKIAPILAVINVSMDDFYNHKSGIENPTILQSLQAENEALKRENQLLRDQVTQQKQMIALLKKSKK